MFGIRHAVVLHHPACLPVCHACSLSYQGVGAVGELNVKVAVRPGRRVESTSEARKPRFQLTSVVPVGLGTAVYRTWRGCTTWTRGWRRRSSGSRSAFLGCSLAEWCSPVFPIRCSGPERLQRTCNGPGNQIFDGDRGQQSCRASGEVQCGLCSAAAGLDSIRGPARLPTPHFQAPRKDSLRYLLLSSAIFPSKNRLVLHL